jgi:hypothetical protein
LGRAAERVADFTFALADSSGVAAIKREARDVDLRDRDADEVLALAADHVALRDVLAKPLANLAADDVAEAPVVLIDL